jgi:hypothetical protein
MDGRPASELKKGSLMDWMNKVGSILQQYTNTNPSQTTSSPPAADVNQHFDSVSQAVPQNVLAQGLSEAFSSNQTAPFGQMVGGLFSRSNPEQKSGLLSRLISALGPEAPSLLAGKGLSGLVGSSGEVNPQAAARVTPDTVTELAAHAQKQNPSIVDSISGFYAQHPTLVKTLGAAALAIAMSKISQRAA